MSSNPSFSALPIELIIEILTVASHSSLYSCRLVSKVIHHVVEPIIFRSIAITSDRHLKYYASLAREIKSDSPLRHVRHLWLGPKPGMSFDSGWVISGHGQRQSRRKERIHRVLAACTLRRLDIQEIFWSHATFDIHKAQHSPEELSCSTGKRGSLQDFSGILQHTKRLHLFCIYHPKAFSSHLTIPLQSQITHLDLGLNRVPLDYVVAFAVNFVPFLSLFEQLRVLVLRTRTISWHATESRPTVLLNDLKEWLGRLEEKPTVTVIVGHVLSQEWNKCMWEEAAVWVEGRKDRIWDLANADDGSSVSSWGGDPENALRVWRVM